MSVSGERAFEIPTSYKWDRVKVWGTVQIQPDGENSKIVNDFNVEVKIPLLGGKIEKMVMKEVAKGWADYERVIREFCSK